nr:MAG TPA: hypothetical protein [Caudoviricetes sp.]
MCYHVYYFLGNGNKYDAKIYKKNLIFQTYYTLFYFSDLRK